MFERKLWFLIALLCLPGAMVRCAEPAGWRTDGSGVYPQAVPPKTWAKDKNVVWCAKMPDWSNSSPVLVGEKIFICSEPAVLLCLNRADGRIRWQKECVYADVMTPEEKEKLPAEQKQAGEIRKELVPIEAQIPVLNKKLAADTSAKDDLQKKIFELKAQAGELKKKINTLILSRKYALPEKHDANGYSTCTPSTDGAHVFVIYGTGLVACYDLDGNRLWIKLLEQPKNEYGHSASPLLVSDKLLVHFTDLVALNSKDGAEVWRAKTPTGFGSPVQAKIGAVEVAITSMGSIVRVSDGKVLAEKLCKLNYSSPIVHDGVVYFIQKDGKAVKLPEQPADVLKPEVLCKIQLKNQPYYASPVYHDGLLYAISKYGVFSAIDAKTGQVVYDKELDLGEGTVYPSLALAGNLVFASSDNGTTLVLEPGREYKEVGKNVLEGFRSSPVFEGKRMFIRTHTNLYCIGE